MAFVPRPMAHTVGFAHKHQAGLGLASPREVAMAQRRLCLEGIALAVQQPCLAVQITTVSCLGSRVFVEDDKKCWSETALGHTHQRPQHTGTRQPLGILARKLVVLDQDSLCGNTRLILPMPMDPCVACVHTWGGLMSCHGLKCATSPGHVMPLRTRGVRHVM